MCVPSTALSLTWVSKPTVKRVRKNSTDQMALPGSMASASGYTTNTRPGPGTEKVMGQIVRETKGWSHMTLSVQVHSKLCERVQS